AVAADQRLVSGASGDRVIARAAVDRRRDRVGEDAVALVDAHGVVAVSRQHGDLRDLLAIEAEVGRTVVPDVDLEGLGIAGLQAQGELVGEEGALDLQDPVYELRPLEVPGVHRALLDGEARSRDRVPPAAAVCEPLARRLAGFGVPREAIERVAAVGDLQPTVPAPGGAKQRLPCAAGRLRLPAGGACRAAER